MKEKGRHIIALRKKGKTYGEIAKILNLPKSTVAWWLKDVKISKSLQKQILEKSRKKWRRNIVAYNKVYAKIRSKEAAKIRESCKQRAVKEIFREIRKISNRDLKLLGLALYWAEGAKTNKNAVDFSNSDPFIIQLMMRFFREVCKLPDERIKARIHLYPQIKPNTATNYWSKITGLSSTQFTAPQTQISKASKRKRDSRTLPYGTLHLRIFNTELTWIIKGWIEGLARKVLRE